MRRRKFLALAGGAAAALPFAARAQQAERVQRIGWLELGLAEDPAVQARTAAVKQELEKLGWVEGRNLQIDHRWGSVSPDLAQRFAGELLALAPDVVFCAGSPNVKALRAATSTVPIVFIFVVEPVDQGIIQSLSHPGGNVTGFAYLERTIGAKWVALLTEIAPKVKHIAFIFSPKAAPYGHFYYEAAQAAAEKIGVRVNASPVNEISSYEPIFAQLGGDGGVIFNPDAFTDNSLKHTIELVARYRIPAIYGGGGVGAKQGCLISYDLDVLAQFRQVAPYLNRILRGEKPADLAVQEPTKIQYSINLKTAKALGLTVPLAMQMTADEVIE